MNGVISLFIHLKFLGEEQDREVEEMSAQPTQHEEWVYQRGVALKLKALLDHQGWKEVLEPMLRAEEKQAEGHLLNGDIKDFNEFVQTRSNVKAAKRVFATIDSLIAIGENAAEMLEKEKSEE